MRIPRIEVGLSILALVCGFAATHRWRTALPPIGVVTPSIAATTALPPAVRPESLDEQVDLTITNDPFRLSGKPSSVPYARSTAPQPATTVSSAPRPSLSLKAIVGGPPWQAIVDGIPGQAPGTIVRSGSIFDKLRVRSVSSDTVVVEGADTVWKLTLARSPR